MNADLMLWYASRVSALAAFAILAAALLTGTAIRTAYLTPVARNRAVVSLHAFLSWFWVPLIAVHIVSLVLDSTARVGLMDLVVPFQVSYSRVSATAVGLGTIGLLALVLVSVSAALRRRLPGPLWLWLHRLTYPMFIVLLLHAQLAGTDFSRTAVSVTGWATVGALLVLALPRLAGARIRS